jgi:hypothetical protein
MCLAAACSTAFVIAAGIQPGWSGHGLACCGAATVSSAAGAAMSWPSRSVKASARLHKRDYAGA